MLYALYLITALILFGYFQDETRHFYVRIISLWASIGCVVEMICRIYGWY